MSIDHKTVMIRVTWKKVESIVTFLKRNYGVGCFTQKSLFCFSEWTVEEVHGVYTT